MGKRAPKSQAADAEPAENQPSTSGSGQPSKVVYIGHVPHGFYEKQLKEYFMQFGTVTKVRLSRSKKTTRSRGYAFLEFQSAEVAKIAAEAMHNYMFFGQKLVARVLAPEEVHEELFKGANRVFKKMPWKKMEMERHNGERSPKGERLRVKRAVQKDTRRQQRIQKAGIEYEYEGLRASLPRKAKKTKFAEDE